MKRLVSNLSNDFVMFDKKSMKLSKKGHIINVQLPVKEKKKGRSD